MSKQFSHLVIASMVVLGFMSGCKSSKKVTESPAAAVEAAEPVVIPVAEEGTSLLWQISGNGLAEPSYLFGTIHLIGSHDFFFPQVWTDAFNQTKLLMLELDMDNLGVMMKMMNGSTMKDGKKIEDLVSEEEFQMIETFFTDSLGQSFGIYNKMKPMLASSAAYSKMVNGDAISYEMELVKKAKSNNMEVEGVESVDDQLAMVDQIPMEDQLEMLMAYVTDFPTERNRFKEMTDIYLTQNVEELFTFMMDSPEMDEESRAIMLDARNKKWIPVISEKAAAMPTFFAFGAGHLPGEFGVINLLRQAGYTVKPVR
ncbi:MAG: TraB/GumN family protein [Bacteroidia bacterium]|nr:TraB/GumN family protein [Bacteroidia bacterium]